MRRFLPILLAAPLVGCGPGTDMTNAQIEGAKTAKFDEVARSKVAAGMAAGAEAKKSSEANWAAKRDPAEVARINAERAAMGRPPLGGG
ncbi:hypothetical protein EON82_00545 [bacterium]|nr:MAG: hypothetical protein EON82_00545 [bacterium]